MSRPIINKRNVAFAILARVSARGQQDGQSLDIQLEEGRKCATRYGATRVLEYQGVESGTRGSEDRVILQRLLADAEAGKFEALVVQEPTRLARNLGVMVGAIDRLTKAGVVLYDFDGPIPTGTPEGEFDVGIKAVIGRFTARQGVQKSIKARERILASGKPAAGRPPWGRVWDDGANRYEVVPRKRVQLRRAYELIVRKGISLNGAASAIELAASSLRKAVRQSSLSEVTQHLGGQEFKFKCQPILTETQHRELDATIAANATVRPRTKGKYLLQGLVRCGACGATMTGQTSTKDGKSYSIYRHPPAIYKPGCIWQAPVADLDDHVLYDCTRVVGDSKSTRAAVEQALEQKDAGADDLEQRLAFVKGEIKRIDLRYERTLDTLVNFGERTESRKRFVARAKADEQMLAALKGELEGLSKQASFLELSREQANLVVAKVRSLYWGHGEGTRVLNFDQQREFVRAVIARDSRAAIEGVYVTMSRPAKALKASVRWHYRIQGLLLVHHAMLNAEEGYAPDIIRPLSTEQVKRLAYIADGSPGINLQERPYRGQLQTKSRFRACTSPWWPACSRRWCTGCGGDLPD